MFAKSLSFRNRVMVAEPIPNLHAEEPKDFKARPAPAQIGKKYKGTMLRGARIWKAQSSQVRTDELMQDRERDGDLELSRLWHDGSPHAPDHQACSLPRFL